MLLLCLFNSKAFQSWIFKTSLQTYALKCEVRINRILGISVLKTLKAAIFRTCYSPAAIFLPRLDLAATVTLDTLVSILLCVQFSLKTHFCAWKSFICRVPTLQLSTLCAPFAHRCHCSSPIQLLSNLPSHFLSSYTNKKNYFLNANVRLSLADK